MSKLLFNRSFYEHEGSHFGENGVDVSHDGRLDSASVLFQGKAGAKCVEIIKNQVGTRLYCHYYIGTDWLLEKEVAIHIAPKINDQMQQVDYISMLFQCCQHSDVAKHCKDLYEIKFDAPVIEINHDQDSLTPLLITQFMVLLQRIVKKGLKKSYYRVERNLSAKIKGKILVAQNIKRNVLKSKLTHTVCQYDEFGINSFENQILKHMMQWSQRYLASFPEYSKLLQPIFGYCAPAFEMVQANGDMFQLKHMRYHAFYSEYQEAMRIVQLIVKRFDYQLNEVDVSHPQTIKIHPFWIDMSKLFELYVLGLLKNQYGRQITFQAKGKYGNPDFLYTDKNLPMIIDTKYKKLYQFERYDIDDIRQLSAYARDVNVLKHLGLGAKETVPVVNCLIVYPDQAARSMIDPNLTGAPIQQFVHFYKMPIRLPTIQPCAS